MLSVWGHWHPRAAGVMAVPMVMSMTMTMTMTVIMSVIVTSAGSSERGRQCELLLRVR